MAIRVFYRNCGMSVTVYARSLLPLFFSVKHITCHNKIRNDFCGKSVRVLNIFSKVDALSSLVAISLVKRPLHWRKMQIFGWEFLAVFHHTDKFWMWICENGHMILICYATIYLKAYITYGWKLLMVMPYWSCTSGDITYLICQVISPNHMIEESCNFMSGMSSLYLKEI